MIPVVIDRAGCVACGTCWDTCPTFFEQNTEDTFSEVVTQYRKGDNIAEGDAPDDLSDCVLEAADNCPVQVITVGE